MPTSKPILLDGLQTLFWQVVEARKGVALAGRSQAMILACVPFTSFLALPEESGRHRIAMSIAELLIVDAQFQPLVILGTAPLEKSIERLLADAHISYIHVSAGMERNALTAKLYEALSQ